jgi:TolA-binding protein
MFPIGPPRGPLFDLVLADRTGRSTKAQKAYGAYGKAVSLAHRNQYDQAERFFKASLSQFKEGSWHDETLYALGTMLLNKATPADGEVLASPETAGAQEPRRTSRKELQARIEQEAQGRAELRAAQLASLPYWRQLTKRYPESPRCETALYLEGTLALEAERHDAAASAFQRLATRFPNSPLTGDSCLRLIDIELEYRLDLAEASAAAETAIQWLAASAHNGDEDRAISSELWSVRMIAVVAPGRRETTYRIHMRAGFIAYLTRQFKQAVSHFMEARKREQPTQLQMAIGRSPSRTTWVIRAAQDGRALTPEAVLKGDDRVALLLQIADIYHVAGEFERSLNLCERALTVTRAAVTKSQQSWATYRRGRNRYFFDEAEAIHDPKGVMADYVAAYEMAPRSEWAGDCLFLTANILFNSQQDRQGAVAAWERLLQDHPQHREADRAAYYIGIAYETANQVNKAIKAYERFLRERPESAFARLVRRRLKALRRENRDEPPTMSSGGRNRNQES